MATTIPVHRSTNREASPVENPLPKLLQTPSGLAVLELQGTINLPHYDPDEDDIPMDGTSGQVHQTSIGRLIFPEYDAQNPQSTKWMKRVYLYVGKHQRLTGEVKKLPKAFAIIRKRETGFVPQSNSDGSMEGLESGAGDELEIVEIVKWKILFSTRPEPVGAVITGT